MKIKRILASFAVILLGGLQFVALSQEGKPVYFNTDQMPDLVKCLPAPPEKGSPAFKLDVKRYKWGKQERKDTARAAMACRDAVWTYEALIGELDDHFGLVVSEETTPAIWTVLDKSLRTVDQIRVAPKAWFHRIRPFEYFKEPTLTGEDDELRGEGSYPSGHTIRSWLVAMLLAEVNPAAADYIYARAWEYGNSRVIAGAHWQSDVDASRVAASIGFASLQTSEEFQKDMSSARDEFSRLTGYSPKSDAGDCFVACGDQDLYIVDAAASEGDSLAILWHWNTSESHGQIPEEAIQWIRVLDDCKPVNGGEQLLLTSSAGGTLLLDIATKKCLFYARTPMSHSAEMLPGGRIAVANSTHPEGNSLEIYDQSRSNVCVWKDSLYFGHGVVWSEKYRKLFVLAYEELRKYSLKDWETESPSLFLEETVTIPGVGGHDLVPAGEDALLVTNHEGIFLFDIRSKSFTPFEPLEGIKNVKSVNYDKPSGHLVYTVAETRWWTNHVYFKNPDKVLSFPPEWRLYKVRTLNSLKFKPES